MKIRNIALVLAVVLVLSTFSGCGLRQLEARVDAVEDAVENRVDRVEDKVENAVESAFYGAPENENPKAQAGNDQQPVLSAGDAEKIALEHAGLTADQVTYIHTEYETDDGVNQFEVQFRHGRWEYDYDIHADTGDVLSYDMDD